VPNISDIRFHIKSVAQTRQITNAMHMVSAARMRRAMDGIRKNQTYFFRALDVVADILDHTDGITHPYLTHRKGEKVAYVVVAGEKGLSGSYNHNVLTMAERSMAGRQVARLFTIGSVAASHFLHAGLEPDRRFERLAEHQQLEPVRRLAEILTDLYDSGEIDELRIVYTRFINTLTREPTEQKLLPLEPDDLKKYRTPVEQRSRGDILYEPSPAEVLNTLIPQLLIGYLYGAIVNAYASENCSRMTAMESATRSADKMLDKLTQQYHTLRQLTITNELADIIGAANATQAVSAAQTSNAAKTTGAQPPKNASESEEKRK